MESGGARNEAADAHVAPGVLVTVYPPLDDVPIAVAVGSARGGHASSWPSGYRWRTGTQTSEGVGPVPETRRERETAAAETGQRMQTREKEPRPSALPLVIDDDVLEVQSREFQVPAAIQPSRRHRVRSVQLYVSTDRGTTEIARTQASVATLQNGKKGRRSMT